ncbi:multidrug resistance-associated protein 1-like [Ixodes scapularis]|nr:multidrug resistance-associated protein 1-like [Ixodes scapularis]
MGFEGFCKTPFWDLNVTWHTENPQLTPCFEFTVLTWIPFLVLVVSLPSKMASSLGPKVRPYPMTLLTYLKYFMTSYLCLIYSLGIYADHSSGIPDSEFTASIVQTAGCSIALLYQIVDQRRARRTSDVLFTYWTMSMLCSFPTYYRMFRNTFSSLSTVLPSGYHYTVSMIVFPVICCLVVLYSFTERHISDTRKPCPLDVASLPSSVSFEWFTPLILTGFRKTLKVDDLFAVSKKLKTVNNYTRWMYKNDETIEGHRLVLSLFRTYWLTILATCAMMLLFTLFRTLPPVLLTLIIRYVSSKQETWKGYIYGVSIFVAGKIGMTLLRHCDFHFVLLGLQIKGILVNAVYKKTLRIASASLSKYTIGEIINLITVDADKVYQTSLLMGQGLTAFFMSITVTIWLWHFVGPSALAVPVVTLTLIPLTAGLTRVCSGLQQGLMILKDSRLMYAGEALGNIKILKFYAWEVPFMEHIFDLRDQEVATLKKYTTLAAFMRLFWFTLPFMQSLAVFSIYMFASGLTTLDIETGFVTITLCNMLRQSLAVCPDVISNLIQTRVAFQRIGEFLDADEKDSELVGNNPGSGVAIRIDNASFAWSTATDAPPLLKNINLTVTKGQLVGIFGLVGAGKSSLLNAMLGEMCLIEGTIDIEGSVAYVPQRAWIIHGTIRKNITFMNEYEKYFYRKVADKCCLKSDFDMLMDGDQTEIGEKGVNLSGGQRQRISLARAVYLDKDVYLLDDPLSAVDAQVGSKIFSKVIGHRGLLREKTRIFVTNNLSLLKLVDVVVFMQNGRFSDYGSFSELMAKGGDFAKVVTEHSKIPHEEDRRDSCGPVARVLSLMSDSAVEFTVTGTGATRANALVGAEVAQVGSIQRHVYTNYVNHMGTTFLLVAFTGYILCRVFDVSAGLWIGSWSRDAQLPKEEQTVAKRTTRIVVFGAIGLFMGMFAFLGTSMLSVGAVRASRTLHENMLRCLFEAPMSFFDTTPLGRILNRVGKDVDQLDIQLPMMANMFFELFFQLLAMIILITVVLPSFLIAAVPLTMLYLFMRKLYLKTLRQLKRLESITRSPVVNAFAETLDGLSSIRSYGAEELFIDGFLTEVDKTQNCSFFLLISKLWMISRLDVIGCTMILVTAFLIVYWRGQMAPGTAGVILSYMLTSTFAFNNLIHFAAEAEAAIVSSERVEEYSKIEGEAPRRVDPSPPEDWPQKGVITFVNFSARYRDGLGLCIRDVNLEFEAAEKVAIVGRTGAGKSTMTLALFRILEAAKGSILIDNVDISKVGLHDLRSKLTIIPQDAILFSGTLRMNLDPEDQFEDIELWDVLERTKLKGRFPEGLETPISEGGHNISVGQRQLVCLARAVLKSTKILILDEATAAVDVETDALIQRTIKTVFRDSTVLTIAHRLNTILDSDKIVVMADGEVIEVGSPAKLLADPTTEFYSMAKESGIV